MKEMAKAADQSAREIRTVAKGNQQHSKGTAKVVAQLADIRRITQRNAEGVSRTRGGTADLIDQARSLTSLMNNVEEVAPTDATAVSAADGFRTNVRGGHHRPPPCRTRLERVGCDRNRTDRSSGDRTARCSISSRPSGPSSTAICSAK